MTVKHIQRIGDEKLLLAEAEYALRFRAPFTVTDVPEATSPGMSGNGGSVRGFTEIGLDPSAAVSSYIQPTGSGGTAGLRVGRFDIDASGPIPGSLTVGNDDGTGDALKIDGGTSIITSTYALTLAGSAALTVGGVTTLGTTVTGDAYVAGTLGTSGDTAIGGSLTLTGALLAGSYLQGAAIAAPAAPAAGLSNLFFDVATSRWSFRNNGSSTTLLTIPADLASYVPTSRTVAGTAGDVLVNGGSSAVALSTNLTLSLAGTITGPRTFSGALTLSASSTALSVTNNATIGGTLTVNSRAVVGRLPRAVSGTATAAAGDVIIADASGGGFTITIPVAAGFWCRVKRKITDTSGNAITLSPASGTIEGSATIALGTLAGTSVDLESDGTNVGVF